MARKIAGPTKRPLEQVWFCGVHSDIGGGEPDDVPGITALSDITLSWMLSKATALGLQIDSNVQTQYASGSDAAIQTAMEEVGSAAILGGHRKTPTFTFSILTSKYVF